MVLVLEAGGNTSGHGEPESHKLLQCFITPKQTLLFKDG
jgi:hypothetical protein